MLYALIRAIAGVALRWYYRDIQVEGVERIPRKGPLLLVVNHPNALVDAMLVAWLMPRRVLLTAKSTLFVNPIANAFFKAVGVVPLYRTSDVARDGKPVDPERNRSTFRAVVAALHRNRVVMIFPEGKSHDEPSLAPLKSGAARMALEATRSGATRLAIVPIGLTFERKEAPRTRVLVQVGEPVAMDAWHSADGARVADALTAEIDARLRAVTLNYASTDDAARAIRLASLIAVLFEDVPAIGVVDRQYGHEAAIARRIEEISARLSHSTDAMRAQADQLVRRLDAVQRVAAKHGVMLEDVGISLGADRAAKFIAREGWLLLIGGPIALWGRINHWLPFRAARAVAMRSIESASDPAMRTLVAGASLVLLTYLLQTVAVGAVWGPVTTAIYLASLPIAADINFYLSDRLERAARRARAFVLFKRDPGLQRRLSEELAALRAEVTEFDQALRDHETAESV
ncbi:MAG TPA: lysophospholipid acyltransferase family protein [Gemmatimonadaceae bacterium]